MALKERWVPILFQKGLDTETNEKTVVPGTLTDCENGTFRERITIVKRPGTRTLGRRWSTPSGYSQLSGALGLASRDSDQDLVVMATTDELGSYDPSTDSWVRRGDWASLDLDLESPARGPNEGWDATACSSGSVQLWAWEDLRGGVYARVRNLDTAVAYGPEFRVSGQTGRQPTALAVGSQMHVYFTSGTANTMNVAVVNPANPTAGSSSLAQLHSAISGGNPTYCVDTLPGWNTSRIAIAIPGATYVAVVKEDGTIGASGSTPSWPSPVTFDASQVNPSLGISGDGTRMAVAVKGDAAHSRAVYARVYDPVTFGVVTSSVTLDSGSNVIASDASLDSIAVGYWGASGSRFLGSWSSVSASAPSLRHVRLGYVDARALPYAQVSSGVLVRHTDLNTVPFRLGDRAYVWGTQASTAQTTDFMVRDDGDVEAVSRYSMALPVQSGVLGRVEVRTDRGPLVARRGVTSRDQFIAVSGGLSSFGDRHPELLSLTYHPSASWHPADVGGALYMPGGYLGKYDGSSVTENGFLMMVEGLSGSIGSASLASGLGILISGSQYGPLGHSGPIASASFVYEVLPVAYDARGNEEQGGCVSLLQVYLTASSTQVQNTASLTWNTIAHTRRNGDDAPDIRFKVFRTGFLNGTPLTTRQRIDDPARPVVNGTGSDTVTFNDTVPTAVQALGEVSYTQLSPTNGPTPACQFLVGAGDRLYVAGLEGRPLDVAPSKLRLGGPVAFADGASFSVDSDGGAITGIGAIDQDIAVFKATRAYHTVADGPDNTLTDTTPYPQPQLVNSDVGAPAPSVIIQSAGADPAFQGLIFRSSRGFRLLQRGITMVDIGSRMRRFDGLSVVGGLSPSNSEEARFYTAEGNTLVLNTRYNEWSTFPEQGAVAAAPYRGAAAFVGADGRVRVESSSSWLDNSTPYSLRMATGWLPLQGLQGLSRVRRLLILGDFHSHHTLRVEMAVDYRDSWRVVKEVDTRRALGVTYYGGPQDPVSSSLGAPAFTDLGAFAGFPVVRYSSTGTVGNGVIVTLQPGVGAPKSGTLAEFPGNASLFSFQAGVTTVGDYEGTLAASSSLLVVATGSSAPSTVLSVTTTHQLLGGFNGTSNAPAGSTMTYGSGSYGGHDPVYQLEFRLPVERFQTCRFRFSDVDQELSGSAEPGRSYSLTEMRLLVATDTARPSLPTRKVR